MQAEINGLMMAKKNSAVLWTVDQHTNDSDVKAGRKTAQKNIGITKDTAHNPPTGKLIDYAVEHNFIKKVTLDSDNDLTAEFGRPTLDDMTYVQVAGMNMSIGTHPNDGTSNAGKIETQDLTLNPNSDVSTNGDGTTYVSSIAQASNGKVTYKTQTITEATDEQEDPTTHVVSATKGITALCSDTLDSNHTVVNTKTVAVTPSGLKTALTFETAKDQSVVTNTTTGEITTKDMTLGNNDHSEDKDAQQHKLSSNTMVYSIAQASNGKVTYKTREVAVDGTAITIDDGQGHASASQSVVTDANGHLTTENMEQASPTASGNTNAFIADITQSKTGKINAEKKTLAAATSNDIGGIKIGYQTSADNRNYAVQLDDEKAYVNVPWENTHYTSKNVICKSASGTDDTAVSTSESAYLNHVENGSVTDYHKIIGSGITVAYNNTSKTLTLTSNSGTVTSIVAGTGLTTNPATGITGTGSISLNAAGDNALGGIKLGYTDSTSGTRNYAVNVDSNGKAYVNVPWTGTVTSIAAGTGLTTNKAGGGAITDSGSISLTTAGTNALGGIKLGYTDSTVGSKNYAVNVDSNGKAYVNVPWTGTVTSISAGTGLTTNQTGGGAITSSGTISVKADGTSITVGSSGIKVADPLPTHDTTTSGKYLGVKNDGTTDWLTVPQNVPIYTDYTDKTSVVGWKIATTRVSAVTSNCDSSSVSAWVTIRSRDATSNPRNQGTLFAGYLWINYRGNGTSTPTMSTVFNSLTNYTNGWKLYRHQYTVSDRYVSDWYVCLPSTVQWIEITIHVLGTVGAITLCTDRVSEIGSGWIEAIEASKTPFMLGSGGVGGPNKPVYVNDDGKIVASSQIHTMNIGGTGTPLPSYVTADQYSEIQAAVTNHEDLAVWYNSSRSQFQYYYNGSTSSGYLFYRVGATEVSILQVDHAASGPDRHDVTITTHQYDSSTQSEYLYSQAMIRGGNYSTIEAGTIASQGGNSASVWLTESTDTNLSNIVTQLKMSSGQLLLKDTTASTQNQITSSQIQLTSGNIKPITINTTGFATSNGKNSVVILNNGSGITATDANGTSTFTGSDGANHWCGYALSFVLPTNPTSDVLAFL